MGKHVQLLADHLQILLFASALFVLIIQVHGNGNFEFPSTLPDGTEQKEGVCVDETQAAYHLDSQDNEGGIPFKRVDNYTENGAVCIDGTPGGYYYVKGSDDGANNWIVYHMGGGWCGSYCRDRYKTGRNSNLGSTKDVGNGAYGGMLSSNKEINPDFHNWNRAFVYYCDGGCFLGDTEVYDSKVNDKLQLRGSRIWSAVMDELMAKGMKNANNAILTGGSAGGLSTMLHCDGFRALIPNANRVKCISDSGFFARAKDVSSAAFREYEYADVVAVHNLTSFLPTSCTSRMNASLCLFPENFVGDIKTPLFILNSAFDAFEINWELQPDGHDHPKKQSWDQCTFSYPTIDACTPDQIQLIKDFRKAYLETLKALPSNPSRGFFINSCYNHMYVLDDKMWNSKGYQLENKTIAQAISDWYFDRSSIQLIDTQADFALNCRLS